MMMTQRELLELLQQLKDGDNSGLNSVFTKHARYCINGLIKKHGCTREDAEDIYTDSVLNFREKLLGGRIEYLTDLRSYLFATCNNMFLARLKRESRVFRAAKEIFIGVEQNESGESEYREELLTITEAALSRLQEKCRDLLTLFYFQRASLEEIASRYKMANANVAKVSKARCFQKLIAEVKSIRERKSMNSDATQQ